MRFWLDVIVLIAVVANVGYTWWSNREKVNARRFGALEKQVSERLAIAAHNDLQKEQEAKCAQHRDRTGMMEKDLREVEAEIRHLPTSRDLAAVAGKLENIEGSLKGLTRAVDLMNEHLLNGGGRK